MAGIASIAAVALLALAAADLALTLLRPISADPNLREGGAADRGLDADLSALTRNNIFAGAPETQTAEPVSDDLPVTTLRLKLKSAVPAANGKSTAIIETPGGVQELFALDDEVVRGVTIHSIERTRVILSRNGRLERLLLDNRPEVASDIPVMGAVEVPAGADEAVSGEGAAIPQDGQTLEDLAGPAFAFFASQGAEPNDVPLAINGQPIGDRGADWDSILRQADDSKRLVLTVLRDGARQDISISLPNDLNL